MVITGGWCPEFWRWRVSACSERGITLSDRKGRVRIEADQWLPWLAGRCQLDPTYVDGQRIACPAAVPMLLPGDVAEPFPMRPPPEATDLASRLQRAREVLAHYRIYPIAHTGKGTLLRVDGTRGKFDVWYDVPGGQMPLCNCSGVARFSLDGRPCKHGLAVLLGDPAAKVLLLRALT